VQAVQDLARAALADRGGDGVAPDLGDLLGAVKEIVDGLL
jgi:hypothetical protein